MSGNVLLVPRGGKGSDKDLHLIRTSNLKSVNWSRLHYWTKEHFKKKQLDFTILNIDRKALEPIYKELKNLLVDVKVKDGTEVVIRL
jgi:plasmid replication initiation protein